MRTNLRSRPTEKLAFFDNHFMFVSRTPDAVMDAAIGLRELPDNPVLACRRPVRFYGRPQSNRLTDFELVRCHALARRPVNPQTICVADFPSRLFRAAHRMPPVKAALRTGCAGESCEYS